MSNYLDIHSKPPAKESCSQPSQLVKESCIGSSSGPPSTLTGLRVTLNTAQESSSIIEEGHTSVNIHFTTTPQDSDLSDNQRCKDSCEDLSFLLEKRSNMHFSALSQTHSKSVNHATTSVGAQTRLSSSNEPSCDQTFIPGLGDVDVVVPDKPASRPTYSRLITTAVDILRQFGLGKEDLDKLLSYPDEEINRNSLPSILEQIHNEKVNRQASPDQPHPKPPQNRASDANSDSCGDPGQPEILQDKQDALLQCKVVDHGYTSKNIGGIAEGKELKNTTSDCASAGLMLKIPDYASLGQEAGTEKCSNIDSGPNLVVTSQSDFSKQSPASSTLTSPVVSCAITNDPIISADTTLNTFLANKVQSDFGSQSDSCIQIQTVQPVLVTGGKENISHSHSPTDTFSDVETVRQLIQQKDGADQMSAKQKEQLQQPMCCLQEKPQPMCEVHVLPSKQQQELQQQLEEEQDVPTKAILREQQQRKLNTDMPPLDERAGEITEDQEMPKQKQCCQSTKCSCFTSKPPVYHVFAVSKSVRESKYNPDTSQLKVTVTLPVLTQISCSPPPSTRNKESPQTKELVTPDPESCEDSSKSDPTKDMNTSSSKSIQESSDAQGHQHCLNTRDSKDKPCRRSQSSSQPASGRSLSEGNNSPTERSHRSHASPDSPTPRRSRHSLDSKRERNGSLSSSSHCTSRERTSPHKRSPGQCRGSKDWKEKQRTRSRSRSPLTIRCRHRSRGSPDNRSPSKYCRPGERMEKRRTRSRSRSPFTSRCRPRGAGRPIRTSNRRTASPLRSPHKKLPPHNYRRSSTLTSRKPVSTSRSKERPSLSSASDKTTVLTKQNKSSDHGGKTSAEQLAESLLEVPDVQALSDKCDIDAVVKSLAPAVLAAWDKLVDAASPPDAGADKAEPLSSPLPSSHCSSPDSTPPPVQSEDSCEQSSREGNSAASEMESSTIVHQQSFEEDRSASPSLSQKLSSQETSERPVTSLSPTWSNFCSKFFAADKMPILEPKKNIHSNTDANKPSSPTMVKLCGVLPCITRDDVKSAVECVGKTKSVLLIRCREEAVVCFEREEDAKKLKALEVKGCKITVKPKEVPSEDKRKSPDKSALLANVLVECAEQETSPDKTEPIKSIVVKATSPPVASSTPEHQTSGGEMAADKVSDVVQHQPETTPLQSQKSQDGSLMSIESLKPGPASRARPVTTPEPVSPSALTEKHATELNTCPSPSAVECADMNTSQPVSVAGVDQQVCKPESMQLRTDLLRVNTEAEDLKLGPAATAKPETAREPSSPAAPELPSPAAPELPSPAALEPPSPAAPELPSHAAPEPPSPAAPSAATTIQAEKLNPRPSQTAQECTDVNRPLIGPASTVKPEKTEPPSAAAETEKQRNASSVLDGCKDANELQSKKQFRKCINKQHQDSKPMSTQQQTKQSQDVSVMTGKVEMNPGPGSTAKMGTTPTPPSLSSPSALTEQTDKLNKCPSKNVHKHTNINKIQTQSGIAKPAQQCKPESTQPHTTQKSQIGPPQLGMKNLKTGPAEPAKPPTTATLATKQTAMPGSFRSLNVLECINVSEFQRKLERSCLQNLRRMSKEKFISLNKRQLLITNLPQCDNGSYTENDLINLIKPHIGRSGINVVCIMTEARLAVVIFQYAKYLYDVIHSSFTLRGRKLKLQVLSVDTIASSPLLFFRYVIKQVQHNLVPNGSKTVYFSDISQSEIKDMMEALKSNTSVLHFLPLLNKLFIEFKTFEGSDQFGLWLHQHKQAFGTRVRRLQVPKQTVKTPGKGADTSSRIPSGCDPPFQLTLSSSPYMFMTVTPTFCIPEYVSVNEVADIERVKKDGAKFQTVMLTGLPVKGYTFKDIVELVGTHFPKTSQDLLIHKVIVLPLQRRAFVHFDDWSSCYDFASSHVKSPMSVKGVKLYVHFVINDLFNPCNEENMYTSMMKLSNTPVRDPESLTERLLNVWIFQFTDEVFERVLKMVTSTMGPYDSILPLANRICFEMTNASDANKTPRNLPSQQFSMNPTYRVESLLSLKQRLQNSIEVEEQGTLSLAVKQEEQRSLPDVSNQVSRSLQQASGQTPQSAEAGNPEINDAPKMAEKTETKASVDSKQDETNESMEKTEVEKEVLIPKSQNDGNNIMTVTVDTSDEPCKPRIHEHQKDTGHTFDSENKETSSKWLPEEKSEAQCTEMSNSLRHSSTSDSTTKEADSVPQNGRLKVMEENRLRAKSLKLLNQDPVGSPTQDVDHKPTGKNGGSCSTEKGDSTEKVLTTHKEQMFPDRNSEVSNSTPEMTGDGSPCEVIRFLENQTTVQQRSALGEHEGSLLTSKEAEAACDVQTIVEEGKTLTSESSKFCEGQPAQLLADSAEVMDVSKEKKLQKLDAAELVCENGEQGLSSTEQSSTSKGDETENKSAAVAMKDSHVSSTACEGQLAQNISNLQTPSKCSRGRARSTITRTLAKSMERTVSVSLDEDSTPARVMITRSGRRKLENEPVSQRLYKVVVTVQNERMATRSRSLSPRCTALKKNSDVKKGVTSDLFVNTNTENKLPVKRKRGRPKKVRMNQSESTLPQSDNVNKTEELEEEEEANESPSTGPNKKRLQKDEKIFEESCPVNIKTEVVNESYSDQSIGGSNTSLPTTDSTMEGLKQVDDQELVIVDKREEKKEVVKKMGSDKGGDLGDLDPKVNKKEEERGALAQTLRKSTNDGGGQEQKQHKTLQTTKRQHEDNKGDGKLQSKTESKRFCPPHPTVVQLPEFNPDKPLGQEFIQPRTGYCCSLCAMFYIKEKTALEQHCCSQKHYDNLKAYYQKMQVIQLSSSGKSPLKSRPGVNS
ncbi:uncharacterized protein LOC128755417 isoform X3 [Synchiropus splendidus]|uniref:uncharacterized protein LOC128755417 isoform X3 n=1 Tax=Synchiropus splendidus TaxID=270530 RepID=UPI00237E2D78|nr:uncharacterized protein LOC128755417 isoform X3 [Synchiropus splendidus]